MGQGRFFEGSNFIPRKPRLFYEQSKLFGEEACMIQETIRNWLEPLSLNLEQKVLAELALKLAAQFDLEPHTSTAAELRKTVLELQRQLTASKQEFDPIAELLTR
jgi:hypothetical protein